MRPGQKSYTPPTPDEQTTTTTDDEQEHVDWFKLFAGDDDSGGDWIVRDLIPAGPRVTTIWSTRSGDGKTLLMWELVAAIATGKDVWGREVLRPRRVLVLDYENSAGRDPDATAGGYGGRTGGPGRP